MLGLGGRGWVLPLFSPWSQQVHSQCPGVAAATGHRLDSFNTNSSPLPQFWSQKPVIKVWAGLSSLQRLQRRVPLAWSSPWGTPGHPGLLATSPRPVRPSAQTFSPGWLCASDHPLFFQGHLSLDLGSTCIPGDLVQRSGTYFHLPRPFIGIRPPLEAAEGWMAFGATTQPTILVMKPQGRASLGLVKGASKKQGSVLGLPQENS